MPMSPPKHCNGRYPGCQSVSYNGTFMCDVCRPQHNRAGNKRGAERRKRYGAGWDGFCDALKSYGNVICQHVDLYTRVRCREMAEITHHLLSAEKYPSLLLTWRNVVRVCRHHHPNSPSDPGTALYVPTTWPQSLGGNPPVDVGQTVPREITLWSLETQRRLLIGDAAPHTV